MPNKYEYADRRTNKPGVFQMISWKQVKIIEIETAKKKLMTIKQEKNKSQQVKPGKHTHTLIHMNTIRADNKLKVNGLKKIENREIRGKRKQNV